MLNKKSQVTLFIIIGIILLLTLGIVIYIQESRVYVEPELIEPDLMPVKNYVEDCIAITGENAIGILGMQGGYIEIPKEISEEKYAYISVDKTGFFKIPFWYYNGLSRIPSVEFMENEISDYVTKNIEECINEFIDFENIFDIKEMEKLDTKTSIQERSVLVEIDYPIKIKDKGKGKVSYVRKFSTEIPVRVKQAYDLGVKIMQQENNELYFEDITLDLMTMNPEIPFDGMEITCRQKKWFLSDIKNELQDMLYYNIPQIRIKNTQYLPFIANEGVYEELKKTTLEDISEGKYPKIEAPDDAYEYNHYLWDVKTKPQDLTVAFSYLPNYGMNIEARPSESGILKSGVGQGASKYLRFMCINFYHFTYDLWYPIEVMIKDDTAFSNKGFVFRFGFPVLIDHNQGKRVDFGRSLFTSIIPEYKKECTQLSGEIYDIRALGIEEGVYGVELDNVNISYNCYRSVCELGTTKADQGVYRLRTQLPSNCAHGILEATKEGYLKGETQVLDDTFIQINMKKLKKFDFKVVQHKYFMGVINEEEDIKNYTSALISLESYDDKNLVEYKKYPFDEEVTEEGKKVELIEDDSKYALDIVLVDDVDGIAIGGYNGNWTVSYDEMYGKNEIIFHVIEYLPKPLNENTTFDMLQFLDENKEYKMELRPEFR